MNNGWGPAVLEVTALNTMKMKIRNNEGQLWLSFLNLHIYCDTGKPSDRHLKHETEAIVELSITTFSPHVWHD